MGYQRIHTSPIDSRHMIEVWENELGERRYLPYYSRTGRSWSSYKERGLVVACKSYANAMKYIKR